MCFMPNDCPYSKKGFEINLNKIYLHFSERSVYPDRQSYRTEPSKYRTVMKYQVIDFR
jgi:hypothetical protein